MILYLQCALIETVVVHKLSLHVLFVLLIYLAVIMGSSQWYSVASLTMLAAISGFFNFAAKGIRKH